jgi:hypothetical protein
MRFFHPTEYYKFEIPDAWLMAARANNFIPQEQAFTPVFDPEWPSTLVDALQITGTHTGVGMPQFDEARMVSVLRDMVKGAPLPAIWCSRDTPDGKLVLRHGRHRFHAAVALKFKKIPVSIRPHFEI